MFSNSGLGILPGIRMHSPGAHLKGSSKEMHPLNFMLVFPLYVAARHKRGRVRQTLQVLHMQWELPARLNESSNARKQGRRLTLSSLLPAVWLPTPPRSVPLPPESGDHPSADSPKAVPAAALLNALRNIATAYTLGRDGMETITG